MGTGTLIINARIITSGKVLEDSGIFINSQGRIADVFGMPDYDRNRYGSDVDVLDIEGRMLCPGLIDTHIHGIAGYEPDCDAPEPTLEMSKALVRFGVTGFLPTLYAGREEKMKTETRGIVKAMGHETGARILGINHEGPFLSPAKCGAQDPASLVLPDADIFNRLVESGEGHVLAMTIAPELEGLEKITAIARDKGVVLLMGHTNATYEQANHGKLLGINHATHLFNAMSPINHKNPGVAGAVVFDPDMHCEIIADGIHVHKDLVRHVIRSRNNGSVVLITDSLRPTSLGPGKYTINGDPVVLGDRGAFVMERDPSILCGSALTLNMAVRNVASWTGDTALAVRMATENPASVYGFRDLGAIARGKLADVAVFDDDFNATEVFIGGKLAFREER